MANHEEIAPVLTVSDVAHLLNLHINTVRRWSNKGTLEVDRVSSRGDQGFCQKDIANLLSQE